ncbi:JmjC domain-containing protein [Cupriavidus necator]|uniref:JmjC domain-containing protein n=1 Tax=Cupriavidus necator TaxID=106590 RepID=UPI00339D769B
MNPQSLAERILDSEAFMLSYMQRRLWKGRTDAAYLQSVFSWRHLNHLLSTHRITNDRLRLSQADDFSTSNKLAFRQARDQFGRPTDFLSINELHRLMGLGVTGVLEATNELIPRIEALTTTIRARFDAQSSANAYFSFGSTSGFGAHHDDHDVIVIQFNGRKHWHFFRTAGSSSRATVENLRDPGAGDRAETMLLQEGDIMFVPKGTWHDVVALDEPSLHVTVSIVYPTISEFLCWLMQQHQYGPPFRDIRMASDDLAALAAECSTFFGKVTSEDTLREFLRAYYTNYAANRIAPSFPTLNRVGAADSYRRLPYSFSVVAPMDGKDTARKISALGRQYNISDAEYRILDALSYKHFSSLADIQASIGDCIPDRETVTAAVERLLDRGLISKAHDARDAEH